eukprot:gnl/MRDRNA2_/MRDRNA2_168905_c0_seq1.p2 gnl/MRDRNA2_/MRDRNA2_168905_c0~~gnl/MRDRNA2_/MRDRNA2_168905_c0_seq1.p2  ORF type:complete len:119 (-),score=9.74 gnl/MRDRNA2_/MRDRNA2_168905_c0_seq1:125-481(-)
MRVYKYPMKKNASTDSLSKPYLSSRGKKYIQFVFPKFGSAKKMPVMISMTMTWQQWNLMKCEILLLDPTNIIIAKKVTIGFHITYLSNGSQKYKRHLKFGKTLIMPLERVRRLPKSNK